MDSLCGDVKTSRADLSAIIHKRKVIDVLHRMLVEMMQDDVL